MTGRSDTRYRWVEHDGERILVEAFGRGGGELHSAEHVYEEALHPRSRVGEWIDKIGGLKKGEGVRLRGASGLEHVAVHKVGIGHYRVQRLTHSEEAYTPFLTPTPVDWLGHAYRRPSIETEGKRFATAKAAGEHALKLHDEEAQRRKETGDKSYPKTTSHPSTATAPRGSGGMNIALY